MSPRTALELTGPQIRPLSNALRETLRLAQFDQLLKLRLNVNREDIALGDDYQEIVFRVINEANRAGLVYKLVDAARQERPKNSIFVEYARMLGVGLQGLPENAQLESIISRTNTLLNISEFRSRLGEIEGQVCRVELEGRGVGTGFLVGPSVVITNYHVMKCLFEQQKEIREFTCRFDFKVCMDGSSLNSGILFKVADLITYRPYDEADLKKDTRQPEADNLDYALLLLEGEPGNEAIGDRSNGDARGWIPILETTYRFAPGSPLFIVQHPDNQPMKLALDTNAVIGVNDNGTRVEYRTNTEPGSSGSPCFNQNWDLVALHHSGDLNWIPRWNEGIPIALIASDLKQKGFTKYIG